MSFCHGTERDELRGMVGISVLHNIKNKMQIEVKINTF
jgi:hypothetical protein